MSIKSKAQQNVYYEHQKKIARIEEEQYESYMPPTPQFIAPKVEKKKAWGLILALRP